MWITPHPGAVMDRAPAHTDRCVTNEPKTHVPSTTGAPVRRRATWSAAARGVAAAGGALAVALLATAGTQASATVPEERSEALSAAADIAPKAAKAAPQEAAELAEDAAPRPAEPAPSDEAEPTPVPATASESGPTDQSTQRPATPATAAELAEQGLVVTG